MHVDPNLGGTLPAGIRLQVIINQAPLLDNDQEAGDLGGGDVQALGSPVDIRVVAEEIATNRQVPLPDTVAQAVAEVILPAPSSPPGAEGEVTWLVEARQDSQFFGYLRVASTFDPATNRVVFLVPLRLLDGTLFLPVLLREAYLANFDASARAWSSPFKDALDFGVAAPQWTRMRVLGPQVGGRIFVLNSFTGRPGLDRCQHGRQHLSVAPRARPIH